VDGGSGGGSGHAEEREPACDRAQYERRDRGGGGAGEARAARGRSKRASDAQVATVPQRRRGGARGDGGRSAEAREERGGAWGHRGSGRDLRRCGGAGEERVWENLSLALGRAMDKSTFVHT
jgi:hypothetical protein